jgi:hypothetical protein
MKVGDIVESGQIKGRLVKIQPKTQDLIVEDSKGKRYVLLSSRTELVVQKEKENCTSDQEQISLLRRKKRRRRGAK